MYVVQCKWNIAWLYWVSALNTFYSLSELSVTFIAPLPPATRLFLDTPFHTHSSSTQYIQRISGASYCTKFLCSSSSKGLNNIDQYGPYFPLALTQSLIRSLTHALYSLMMCHSLMHSLTHSCTHSLTCMHSLTHSCTHSLTHALTHPPTHPPTHSL